MAGKLTKVVALLVVALVAANVDADDNVRIPSQRGQVNSWFSSNVLPLSQSKGLDPALVAAETGPAKVIKVMKDGSGDFKTVTEAINSVPSGNYHTSDGTSPWLEN